MRVSLVDADANEHLTQALGVEQIPTLVLVKDRKPVARLEGRVSAPQIERMLEPYLVAEPVAA